MFYLKRKSRAFISPPPETTSQIFIYQFLPSHRQSAVGCGTSKNMAHKSLLHLLFTFLCLTAIECLICPIRSRGANRLRANGINCFSLKKENYRRRKLFSLHSKSHWTQKFFSSISLMIFLSSITRCCWASEQKLTKLCEWSTCRRETGTLSSMVF